MRSLQEQIARKCIHFNGISSETCEAGVKYADVRDNTSRPYKFPCFRGEGCECEKQQFPTDEEVAERVRAIEESSTRNMNAMKACFEDAAKHGYKKGNGGAGQVQCPVCGHGELHYSVASLNGHLWGKCATPNCVAWMM